MRILRGALPALACAITLVGAPPATADHTDPAAALVPLAAPTPETGLTRGEGSWEVVAHFPPNPATDLDVFTKDGVSYAAVGTLGGGATGHVGQRVLRLTDAAGEVSVAWVADHGSAACAGQHAGSLRLQHDVAVTPDRRPQLLVDTTDGEGRCHDPAGGGLELVDVSGLGLPGGAPMRELHLTRHNGTTHTVTIDDLRPWLVYASNGEYNAQAWIDVLDVRSCLDMAGSLAQRRAACRPVVHRIPLDPLWTSQRQADGTLGEPRSCHDITARGPLLYCAAIGATVILDVAGLTDAAGAVRGTPLPCRVVAGTATGAAVSDCTVGGPGAADAIAAYDAMGRPAAEGWRFVGTIHHAGIDDREALTNRRVPSSEGIAISHQAEPVPAVVGPYLVVSDERGGGVRPGGASCTPGADNPISNGGLHVFDVSNPTAPVPAPAADGGNAVFIATPLVAADDYCTVHVFHHLPEERRIVAAWYRQGVVLVDYDVDAAGRWSFREVAALALPGAQAWAADLFRREDHGDGTATYWFVVTDMTRGVDVVAWTGPANPIAAPAPAPASPETRRYATDASRKRSAAPVRTDVVLLALAALALPAAALAGRSLANPRRRGRRTPG